MFKRTHNEFKTGSIQDEAPHDVGPHLGCSLFANASFQHPQLTLSPPNKLSSAKFLVCFNFPSASISLRVGENVVYASNSFDSDETPSHPDPSRLHVDLGL